MNPLISTLLVIGFTVYGVVLSYVLYKIKMFRGDADFGKLTRMFRTMEGMGDELSRRIEQNERSIQRHLARTDEAIGALNKQMGDQFEGVGGKANAPSSYTQSIADLTARIDEQMEINAGLSRQVGQLQAALSRLAGGTADGEGKPINKYDEPQPNAQDNAQQTEPDLSANRRNRKGKQRHKDDHRLGSKEDGSSRTNGGTTMTDVDVESIANEIDIEPPSAVEEVPVMQSSTESSATETESGVGDARSDHAHQRRDDIRRLLSEGQTPEQIARRLDIGVTEVKITQQMYGNAS